MFATFNLSYIGPYNTAIESYDTLQKVDLDRMVFTNIVGSSTKHPYWMLGKNNFSTAASRCNAGLKRKKALLFKIVVATQSANTKKDPRVDSTQA